MSEVDKILFGEKVSKTPKYLLTKEQKRLRKVNKIDRFCQRLVKAADTDCSAGEHEDVVWAKVYDVVFSDVVSKRFLKIMGYHLDYYDPDTTYRADATAFINALHEFVQDRENHHDQTSSY